ncbi:MAG: hypothetical protein AAF705_06670, partial [Bacteroidota bacterium]
MAKQKKISFNEFFDRRIKSLDDETYPVYIRTTFDRQNSKIRPFHESKIYWTEDQLKNHKKGTYEDVATRRTGHWINCVKEIIEQVVREKDEKVEDFNFSGVADVVRYYQKDMEFLLDNLVGMKALKEAESFLLAKDYNRMKNGTGPLLERLEVLHQESPNAIQQFSREVRTFLFAYLAYSRFHFDKNMYNSERFVYPLFAWFFKNDKDLFL